MVSQDHAKHKHDFPILNYLSKHIDIPAHRAVKSEPFSLCAESHPSNDTKPNEESLGIFTSG